MKYPNDTTQVGDWFIIYPNGRCKRHGDDLLRKGTTYRAQVQRLTPTQIIIEGNIRLKKTRWDDTPMTWKEGNDCRRAKPATKENMTEAVAHDFDMVKARKDEIAAEQREQREFDTDHKIGMLPERAAQTLRNIAQQLDSVSQEVEDCTRAIGKRGYYRHDLVNLPEANYRHGILQRLDVDLRHSFVQGQTSAAEVNAFLQGRFHKWTIDVLQNARENDSHYQSEAMATVIDQLAGEIEDIRFGFMNSGT